MVLSYPNFTLGQIIDPDEANQNNSDITNKINEFISEVEGAIEIAEVQMLKRIMQFLQQILQMAKLITQYQLPMLLMEKLIMQYLQQTAQIQKLIMQYLQQTAQIQKLIMQYLLQMQQMAKLIRVETAEQHSARLKKNLTLVHWVLWQ